MIENYLDLLESADKRREVKVALFDGYEPVSVFDAFKVKKGTDTKEKLTRDERAAVYAATKGLAFLAPATDAMSVALRHPSIEEKRLMQGVKGLYFARVFNKSVVDRAETKYCDCILNEKGNVLFKSGNSTILNDEKSISLNFHHGLCYDEDLYDLVEEKLSDGFWYWMLSYGSATNEEKIKKMYSTIACYVAEESIEECGKNLKQREFETANQLPARMLKIYPNFMREVFAETEEILCEEVEKNKSDAKKVGIIVSVGERIGRGLKEVFKQKIEEANAMEEFSSDPKNLFNPKSEFAPGTFDVSDLIALAGDGKAGKTQRKEK